MEERRRGAAEQNSNRVRLVEKCQPMRNGQLQEWPKNLQTGISKTTFYIVWSGLLQCTATPIIPYLYLNVNANSIWTNQGKEAAILNV